jgi:hypothetical protein
VDVNIVHQNPVKIIHRRKRGRPRKSVDPKFLHEAFKGSRRIPKTVLANILGIDRKTLQVRAQEHEIDTGFSPISDEELDDLVRNYLLDHPSGGRSYVMGHARAYGLHVQRDRLSDSLNRVNRLGQGMRQQVGKKKERKSYHVPRPNSLWHIDGHHKLILWGIVIHGVVDGYTRKASHFIAFFFFNLKTSDQSQDYRIACKH